MEALSHHSDIEPRASTLAEAHSLLAQFGIPKDLLTADEWQHLLLLIAIPKNDIYRDGLIARLLWGLARDVKEKEARIAFRARLPNCLVESSHT